MSQSVPISEGPIILIRWLVAIVAFPIAGTVGHAVAGPASTVTAALLAGLIAGAIIGLVLWKVMAREATSSPARP